MKLKLNNKKIHQVENFNILNEKFFSRDATIVAKELIGKIICSKSKHFVILEVEAYMPNDPYCHGVKHGRTKSNCPQFCREGCIYIHWQHKGYGVDITTGLFERKPQSVLIRKIAPIVVSNKGKYEINNSRVISVANIGKELGINKNNKDSYQGSKCIYTKEKQLFFIAKYKNLNHINVQTKPRELRSVKNKKSLCFNKPWNFFTDSI